MAWATFLRAIKTDCATVFQKLYVRIWLAVVLAVAMLTFLVGLAWRMAADPPLRDVVVRNTQGEIIGTGKAGVPFRTPSHHEGDDAERRHHETHETEAEPMGPFGRGPEFTVQLQDGQTVHLHLPRPPRTGLTAPFGFFLDAGLGCSGCGFGHLPHRAPPHPQVRELAKQYATLGQR